MMQIAQRGMPGIWIGMGHGDRAGRVVDHIHRCLVSRMGQINDDADAIHFVNHLTAKGGEPAVFGFETTGTKKRLLIIGDLAETNTQLREDLNPANIRPNRQRILQAEQNSGFPRSVGRPDLFACHCARNYIAAILEPTVPNLKVLHHPEKVFMVSNSHMDGR